MTMSSNNNHQRRIFVVGVGMTPFTRPGKNLTIDYPNLVETAVRQALTDARLGYERVQLAVAGYVFGDSTCGQRSLYQIGMSGIPIVNVNNNCSTGSTALFVAGNAIASGKYDCVLALGFEKMEKGALGTKYKDRVAPMDKHLELLLELEGLAPAPFTAQLFGAAGKEHMHRYGSNEMHCAKIAVKNHRHAANNPNAQLAQGTVELEDVLDSAKVHDYLTKLQCCPTSDGAACAILASERFVRLNHLESQAVEIMAIEMATDLPSTFEDKSPLKLVGFDMTRKAAQAAYRKAGVKPEDLDVIELHDCFSCNELITYEALGLCPLGGAHQLVDKGDNTYGGKYVINPSGGLLGKGHPLGATGLAQCAELCWQLRGLADKRQKSQVSLDEFDLEQARHEVFMFGIKGLSHKDRQEAKRELAVRLGAEPKKKRGKNIKQHMEEVRRQKEQERLQREEARLMNEKETKRPRVNSRNKPHQNRLNEVRDMDYQIGKYRNGVQYLSKKDIEQLKQRKSK